MDDHIIAETCIVFRNRFSGWLGKKLMVLSGESRFWWIGAKRIIGPERDQLAAWISQIDLSEHLERGERKQSMPRE